ncbi:hypothetical protein SAMN05444972_104293 [Marininema halotolerans]|uniref:Uncharacterized protein n=1 Tax=Marininema halotolerans TaxID=1155944 RepID=A0A1I6R996_9BACL|nr:hypothetical protein SAMN05444972_104293 [Marininema halotolerans]
MYCTKALFHKASHILSYGSFAQQVLISRFRRKILPGVEPATMSPNVIFPNDGNIN